MSTVAEKRAKLFQNGRSQAVRLPKEYRFEGNEVRIRRLGDSVVLEPVGASRAGDWDWVQGWQEKFGPIDAEFAAAVNEKMPQQERPDVERYFAEFGKHRKRRA
jgi:antitoxin VapB